ncbi:MAG: hypothetical protein ACXIUM_08145 [Wenzhouxiangella sp.]
MREDLAGPAPQGLEPLLAPIQQRFGSALLGILLYGSCRRRDQVDEGLVDLMVLVSDYRSAFGASLTAVLNRLLPPNVYYLEAQSPHGRLRSKYAVISLDQFRRRCRHPIDLYFWARFTQPCRLVWQKNAELAEAVSTARAQAASHFARRIAPLAPADVPALDFWSQALAMTYRCELRPEPPDAARRLIESDPDYWSQLSTALSADGCIRTETTGARPRLQRLARQCGWAGRRLSGKLYNLARLFKAAGTFSNGIDYIVWKVERHSGVRVEPSARMRRHPRLAAWGLAWRLWRQKGFR